SYVPPTCSHPFTLSTLLCLSFYFFPYSARHRDLPSFPTRRSSDLTYTGFRSRANLTWKITPDLLAYYTWSQGFRPGVVGEQIGRDRKSTRLNSSHGSISYAVFCLKKNTIKESHKEDLSTQ